MLKRLINALLLCIPLALAYIGLALVGPVFIVFAIYALLAIVWFVVILIL